MKRTTPILFVTTLFFCVASLPATLLAETRFYRTQVEAHGPTIQGLKEVKDSCSYAAKIRYEHYEQTDGSGHGSNLVTTEAVLKSSGINLGQSGSPSSSHYKRIVFPIPFDHFNDMLSGTFYSDHNNPDQPEFDPFKARTPRVVVDFYHNDYENKTYVHTALQFETIGSQSYETITYNYYQSPGHSGDQSYIVSALKEDCPDAAPVAVYSISADYTYGSFTAERMIDGNANTYFLGASGQTTNKISIILDRPAAISSLTLDWFSQHFACNQVSLSVEQFGSQQIIAEASGSGSASTTLTVSEEVTPIETTQYTLNLSGCPHYAGVIREVRAEATTGW